MPGRRALSLDLVRQGHNVDIEFSSTAIELVSAGVLRRNLAIAKFEVAEFAAVHD